MPSSTTTTFKLVQMSSFTTAAFQLIQISSFRTAAIGWVKFSRLGLFSPFSPSAFFSHSSVAAPVAPSCRPAQLLLLRWLPAPPLRPPTQVKHFACSSLIFCKWVFGCLECLLNNFYPQMRLCIYLISYDQQMHLTQMMIADVLPWFLPVSSLCHVLPIFNLVTGIVHLITYSGFGLYM